MHSRDDSGDKDVPSFRVVKRGSTHKITSGCDKIKYRSKAKAVKAHRTRFAQCPTRQAPYHCRYCGFWHVTTCRS